MNVGTYWHEQIEELRETHSVKQMVPIVGKTHRTIRNYLYDNKKQYKHEADIRRETFRSFVSYCLEQQYIDSRSIDSCSCFAKDRLQRGAIVLGAYQITGILACGLNRKMQEGYWSHQTINPSDVAYARKKGADLIKKLVNGYRTTKTFIGVPSCRREVA